MTLKRLPRGCVLPAIIVFACASASAASLSFTLIQYPGSTYTVAYGINNNGDIVGDYQDANYNLHGFLRSAAGMLSSFDYAPQPQTVGGSATVPFGINDAGQIVGSHSGYPQNLYDAFFRDQSGNYTSTPSAAFSGISDSGFITGYTNAGLQDFIIDPTGHYTYFTPPNGFSTYTADFAWCVNNSGVVVGNFTGVTGNGFGQAAFIRDASGRFTTFTVLGASTTIATGINDSGEIVGYYSGYHGFARSPTGVVQTIDFPGGSNTELHGINDSGEIVGSTMINGITKGFFAAPEAIPEPGGLVSVAIGLLGILVLRTLIRAS